MPTLKNHWKCRHAIFRKSIHLGPNKCVIIYFQSRANCPLYFDNSQFFWLHFILFQGDNCSCLKDDKICRRITSNMCLANCTDVTNSTCPENCTSAEGKQFSGLKIFRIVITEGKMFVETFYIHLTQHLLNLVSKCNIRYYRNSLSCWCILLSRCHIIF